ncbi:MAG: mevalonate kinase [Bacteroidia bacterium]|nr:mevalonate kinase [Bacteroidia bacterium]
MNQSLYYAKILLFGEYGIIEDSMGLSIPYHFYKGTLLKPSGNNTEIETTSNKSLLDFVAYLKAKEADGSLLCKLDFNRLQNDLENGLYFDSSIPQGFGVGSSGALVAAIYDGYAINKISADDVNHGDELVKLKAILSNMENYFHGTSSGLDPLICYLNLPVLIKSKSDMGTVMMPGSKADGEGAIFLMNSGSPGKTQGMVSIFLNKLKEEGFRNLVRTRLKKYNDECIKAFLKGDTKPLFENLKELSSLFLENFKPMIPEKFEELWRKGIETNAYYLKLCGSGGGGFILGFTQNLDEAEKMLKGHQLQVIHKF